MPIYLLTIFFMFPMKNGPLSASYTVSGSMVLDKPSLQESQILRMSTLQGQLALPWCNVLRAELREARDGEYCKTCYSPRRKLKHQAKVEWECVECGADWPKEGGVQ